MATNTPQQHVGERPPESYRPANLRKQVQEDPETILKNLALYQEEPFADNLFKAAYSSFLKKDPLQAVGTYCNYFDGKPYESEYTHKGI